MRVLNLKNSFDFILIDDEDYDRLSKHKNYRFNKAITRYDRYEIIGFSKRSRKLRVRSLFIAIANDVMNSYDKMFDHIDSNPFNNQKNNLREANQQQNCQNRTKISGAASMYKGVSKSNKTDWRANIYLNGRKIHLGCFKLEVDAAKAYDAKAKKLFGEFAKLNFP